MTILHSKEQYNTFKQVWANLATAGKLDHGHHLLYNLIIGRDITTGFTPRTNLGRIQGCEGGPIHGLYKAAILVKFRVREGSLRDRLLELFEGSITPEMLDSINVPNFQPLTHNYGMGKKIFDHFDRHDVKSISFDQLWELLNDVAA